MDRPLRTTFLLAVLALPLVVSADGQAPVTLDAAEPGAVRALAISAASEHTCAVTEDGDVRCWGDNGRGQLGDGTLTKRVSPGAGLGFTDVIAVSAGGLHTCALRASGSVLCWGFNGDGRLGDGTTIERHSPVEVAGLGAAVGISAGAAHTCALLQDGTGRCWGRNTNGELGDGTTNASLTPVSVSGLTGAVGISAGAWHTCARLTTGGARCWGDNRYGQVGDGSTTRRLTPRNVSGITNATSLDAGDFHACVTLPDGQARCWGRNAEAQIGDGTRTNRPSPRVVANLSGAQAISAGSGSTCARLADATARCWGDNAVGDDAADRTRARPVVGLAGVSEVTVGGSHTCAVVTDGSARCWGAGANGQLGTGRDVLERTPVAVATGPTASLSTGGAHSCATDPQGAVLCWGNNPYGQLGDGTTQQRLVPTTTVPALTGTVQVAAAGGHSCARLGDGAVRCWGRNSAGQVGDGTTTDRWSPVPVLGIPDAIDVATGAATSCAIRADGSTHCWGSGWGATPTPVAGAEGAVRVAIGNGHACVVRADGAMRCWGANQNGQLGDGTVTSSSTPVTVVDLGPVADLALGAGHTCALLRSGDVACWGSNVRGQIGAGPDGEGIHLRPIRVVGISGAAAVGAGYQHSCAVLADGSARCWGRNDYATLGDGSETTRTAPVNVTGLTGAAQIAGADLHTCARTQAGALWCWGHNGLAQLGNGACVSCLTPQRVLGLGPPPEPPRCEVTAGATDATVQRGRTFTAQASCRSGDGSWRAVSWLLDGEPFGPAEAPGGATTRLTERSRAWDEPGAHTLTLVAEDSNGRSAPLTWNVRVADSPPLPAPAAPGGLSPGSGEPGQPEPLARFDPILSWVPTAAASSFLLTIRAADGRLVANDLETTQTSWRVPPGLLQPGVAYAWHVSAANAGAASAPSAPAHVLAPPHFPLVVAFGDSVTAGHGVGGLADGYTRGAGPDGRGANRPTAYSGELAKLLTGSADNHRNFGVSGACAMAPDESALFDPPAAAGTPEGCNSANSAMLQLFQDYGLALDSLPPGERIVVMSLGANDIEFAACLTAMVASGGTDHGPCEDASRDADSALGRRLAAFAANLDNLLTRMRAPGGLPEGTRIVLLQYYQPFPRPASPDAPACQAWAPMAAKAVGDSRAPLQFFGPAFNETWLPEAQASAYRAASSTLARLNAVIAATAAPHGVLLARTDEGDHDFDDHDMCRSDRDPVDRATPGQPATWVFPMRSRVEGRLLVVDAASAEPRETRVWYEHPRPDATPVAAPTCDNAPDPEDVVSNAADDKGLLAYEVRVRVPINCMPHPTEAGHQAIARAMKAALERRVGDFPTSNVG